MTFTINGTLYVLTAANLTSFAGTCSLANTMSVNGIGWLFGGTTCSITPSSGGQIDITPGGPINTLSVAYTAGSCNGATYNLFIAQGGCTANILASADTPCAGGTLHLNATSLTGATYSWTGPGSFTSNQQNPMITNVQAAIAGTYTVVVTKDTCIYTKTVNVSVRPKPGLPIASNNGPLCSTSTLYLAATSAGATSYAWTGPANFTSNTQNPSIASVTAANAGLYKVYATAANGCVSDTAATTVQVYPQVTAAFSYNIKWGCSGDTVVFTNTAVNGPASTWYFGDGTTSTLASPTHIYTQQNGYTVKLVSRSANCADSATQVIDLLHPLSASFTVSKDSICQQGTVQFTNTSTTTTKNGITPSWLWVFGDGSTSTAMSPSHNFSRQGIYNVQLIATDFVPCTDTAYHTIVVDSIPFIRFTISDSGICQGQAIHFLGDYLQIGNIGNLEWNLGDSTRIININPVTHGYDQPGTYNVTLTAHYRLCADTTYSRAIDVRPFPGLNIGPDTAICPNGAPITLYDMAGGGGAYLWSTGEVSGAITVGKPGTYWAVKSLNGCTTADTVEVRKNCYTDIPNVFTPNGDGMNDYFFPRGMLSRGVSFFRMGIYNRWGQSVYETTKTDGRGWDGKLNDTDQPQGAYIYTIDVVYIDGTKEKYQGNVTLLR